MSKQAPAGGVDRDSIVATLVAALQPLDHVHAMWQGGAISFGRLDEWSDIDICVDVDDEKAAETLDLAEEALRRLAPIARRYDPPLPSTSGYRQAFFHLEGTSPYLLVDCAAILHTSPDKFLEPEIHGRAVFHFNKGDAIVIPHVDVAALREKLRADCTRLRARAEVFWIFIDKQIARRNVLEAMEMYQRVVLGSLVEALRIRYKPARHQFGTYYSRYDLPEPVFERLKGLYFVRDAEDLLEKKRAAERWFFDEIEAIDVDAIRVDGIESA